MYRFMEDILIVLFIILLISVLSLKTGKKAYPNFIFNETIPVKYFVNYKVEYAYQLHYIVLKKILFS